MAGLADGRQWRGIRADLGCLLQQRAFGLELHHVSAPAHRHLEGQGTFPVFNVKGTGTIEFHRNGRVDFAHDYGGLGGNQGSGSWEVEHAEEEKYVLTIVADLSPDEKVGWSITFEGDDKFVIEGFDDMPYTMERQ